MLLWSDLTLRYGFWTGNRLNSGRRKEKPVRRQVWLRWFTRVQLAYTAPQFHFFLVRCCIFICFFYFCFHYFDRNWVELKLEMLRAESWTTLWRLCVTQGSPSGPHSTKRVSFPNIVSRALSLVAFLCSSLFVSSRFLTCTCLLYFLVVVGRRARDFIVAGPHFRFSFCFFVFSDSNCRNSTQSQACNFVSKT